MLRHKRHSQITRCPPNSGGYLRAVMSVLAILFLAAQTPQSMALAGGSGTSILVEICSEGETYLAPIERGQTGPSKTCAHCSDCGLATGSSTGFIILSGGLAASFAFDAVVFLARAEPNLPAPEQYWSPCRGPPIMHKKELMKLASIFASIPSALVPSDPWGFPWV